MVDKTPQANHIIKELPTDLVKIELNQFNDKISYNYKLQFRMPLIIYQNFNSNILIILKQCRQHNHTFYNN